MALFALLWLVIMIVGFLTIYGILDHLNELGHKQTWPFSTMELSRIIVFCRKLIKETGDKELRTLLTILNLNYAAAVVVLLIFVFTR